MLCLFVILQPYSPVNRFDFLLHTTGKRVRVPVIELTIAINRGKFEVSLNLTLDESRFAATNKVFSVRIHCKLCTKTVEYARVYLKKLLKCVEFTCLITFIWLKIDWFQLRHTSYISFIIPGFLSCIKSCIDYFSRFKNTVLWYITHTLALSRLTDSFSVRLICMTISFSNGNSVWGCHTILNQQWQVPFSNDI